MSEFTGFRLEKAFQALHRLYPYTLENVYL